jgi:hypothetical protein
VRGTLFFVHGTGVREKGFVTTWGRVKDYARMHGIDDGVEFVGCEWGPKLGVRVELVGETLPPQVMTRAALERMPTARDVEVARWDLLLDDPLFELRIAAEAAPKAPPGVVVAEHRADQAAVAMLRGFPAQANSVALEGDGLDAAELALAAERLAGTQELQRAALAAGNAADPDLLEAVATAVVAIALASHRADEPGTAPPVALNCVLRDALVKRVDDTLMPLLTRGALTDWLKDKALAFVMRKATNMAEERRNELMGSSTPAVGDILYYQRRGGDIAQYVADSLKGLKPPVVAVGHSLGGIILVDLLSRTDSPRIDLLVTAGSQSPLFYAIDALERIRRGQMPPGPFPPWLNIYNRQDFLSFCAARVFGEVKGIYDEEIDPGVPFPESHGAYWTSARTYELIKSHWPS